LKKGKGKIEACNEQEEIKASLFIAQKKPSANADGCI